MASAEVEMNTSGGGGGSGGESTTKASTQSNDPPAEDRELSGIDKSRKQVRLKILQSWWFDPFILIVIIINCIILALDNPNNEDETLEDVINNSEIVFLAIYIVEMAIKMFGWGFFGIHDGSDRSGNGFKKRKQIATKKTREQGASVFSYMVNSVFHSGQTQKKDEYVGYFRDGWNWLDFIIIVVGSVLPLVINTQSVTSIRALRILRALRAIPRVPKLRTLVLTLIDSLPGLLGATILLLFFFTVFGIMGVQLFPGQLREQCIDSSGVPYFYLNLDTAYYGFCDLNDESNGENTVANAYCDRISNSTGIYTCSADGTSNPNSGMESWDNIFFSLLQVFQIVTLQDWSKWMYDLSRGESYLVSIFFIPLIFIVSFFALNLVLAVIVDTYSNSIDQVQHEEDYDSTLLEMDDLIQQKTTKRSKPVRQTITYRSYNRKIRSLKEKVKTFEELFKEYNAGAVEKVNKKHELTRNQKMRVDTNRGNDAANSSKNLGIDLDAIAEDVNADTKVDLYNEEDFKDETWQFSKRAIEQKQLRRQMIEDMMLNFNKDLAFEVWLLAKPIKDEYLRGKPNFIRWLHWLAQSSWFEYGIIFVIFLNTIILSIQWPLMDSKTQEALEVLNICFTVLFTIELIIKLVGLGWRRWAYDKFNIFDGVIVLLSIVELFLGNDSDADSILAFRALRVLRVLRLLHKIGPLRILLNSIIESFEPLFYLLLILILFLFMMGVLGVQLLGGKLDNEGRSGFEELTRPWRFDNLWYSMVFMMQLFTGDGWPAVMGDAVAEYKDSIAIVFVVCVVLGLYIFKNMFLAVLINRLSNQDNIQLMIDDLLTLAREKQFVYGKDEKTGIQAFEADVKRVRQERMGLKAQAKHDSRVKKMQNRQEISGKSFTVFGTNFGPRRWLHDKVVNTLWFEWSINVIIIVNCVLLACDNPRVEIEDRYKDLKEALEIFDYIFTFIFVIEAFLKMFAFGVYESKDKNSNNKSNDAKKVKQKSIDPTVENDNNNDNDDDDNKEAELVSSSKGRNEDEEEDDGPCRNAYFKSSWNRLDFFIVIVAVIGLAYPNVGFLRGLRAIRPIRIAIRIPLIKVVVKALLHSAPNVFNAILFAFFIIFVLAIVGVHLFVGQFGRCVYPGNPYNLVESVTSYAGCDDAGYTWVNAGFDFDNVFAALLTVFKIGMFSTWYEELANGMASNGEGDSKDETPNIIPYNKPVAALYFVGVIIIMGFFVFNIIISVVVDSFNRIKRDEETNALLTADQVVWVRKRRLMSRFPLKGSMKPPPESNNIQRSIFDLVTSSTFEYFIIGCILLNTIFLMTEHYGEPEAWKDILEVLEYVFIGIYTLEAILKIYALTIIDKNKRGKSILKIRYFSDPWNVFDFLIVVVSFIGLGFDNGAPAVVVRLLRVARVVRLVKRAPTLRALFLTLVYAAPSLFNIGLLLLVIFFIYGIFGMELFGKVYHNDGYGNTINYDSNDGISNSVNFETFGNSLLILYRTATNDNWGSILLAAGAEGDLCNFGNDSDNFYECGHLWQSIIYFVSFGIFGTLFMINLFVAVILDTYVDNVEFEKKMDKLIVLKEWIDIWKDYDESSNKKIKGRLSVKLFISSLRRCPVLMGLMLDSLNLRLNVEEAEAEMDYNNIEELKRRSSEIYGKIDFVGPPNPADKHVEVTNDHVNALMKTRRLRILCKLVHRGGYDEKLVVYYSDALYAIASLVVGPEHRLLPYSNDKLCHLSDWWSEQLDEFIGENNLS